MSVSKSRPNKQITVSSLPHTEEYGLLDFKMPQTKKKKLTKTSRVAAARSAAAVQEADSIYFLKLVLYLILGSQWLRITKGTITVPLPIGLLVGILLARTDRLSFDRKMAYAILLISMFVGFWLPIGLELVI